MSQWVSCACSAGAHNADVDGIIIGVSHTADELTEIITVFTGGNDAALTAVAGVFVSA